MILYRCDGCREPVETPVRIGKVIEREYCATCAELAQKFVDAEEALRVQTQAAFQREREALIAVHTDFKLPDVP
jgi:hypothetical protein